MSLKECVPQSARQADGERKKKDEANAVDGDGKSRNDRGGESDVERPCEPVTRANLVHQSVRCGLALSIMSSSCSCSSSYSLTKQHSSTWE